MPDMPIQHPISPAPPSAGFPVTFVVDYSEGSRNRLTTFFRVFTAIPIAIVLSLLGGSQGVGLLFPSTLLMILFRQKYPRWWFDWNLALTRFEARVGSYMFLLRDEYPSTDEEQAVRLQLTYPDVKKDLNRWLPLIKWFLAIPHYVVLAFVAIAAFVVTILAWFAILFTGRYPRSWFDFVVGTGRWALRVAAYAFLLTTDEYPPFSLV
jgi:hypothetical protein